MAPLLLSAAVVHRPLHLHLAPLLLLVIMLLIHPYIYMAVAQTTSRNLTAGGDTLTPPSYITSPSGDFAFGFHPLGSGGGFLLAIWFLFDGTVVWFATDAGSGSALVATAGQSVLSVSATGQLSLFNNLGGNNNPTPLWNPTRNSGSSLMLQDDGNLRFIGTDGTSVVWESFRNPTDTLLPGQSMLPDTKLQSRSGDMGLSPGYFSFNVQLDGNLVMYNMDTVQGGSGGAVNAYWSTDTCCAKNTTLFFDIDKVGYLYYVLTTGERRNLTDPVSLPTTSGFYQHATLDQDGLFRVYFHPKRSSGSGNDAASWSVMNQVIPKDGCKALTNGRRGMCGPNSYCITRTDDNRIDCECPSGYVFLDPEIRYKGCTPAFLPDSCDGKKHAAEFDLEDVLNTEWAQLTYKTHTGISSEEQCRGLCLNSCSCAAATFDGNNCSEVVMLLAGWQDNSTTLRTMIKVRTKSPPVQILPYVLVAVLGVLFLTSTCILLVHCYISNKKARRSYLTLSPSVRAFSWKELYHATNGFEKLLGKGSFGEVYKGTMRSPHPHPIAVKKLIDSNEYSEQEFTNEVNSIGQIHHRNLVRMIGYCKEGKHHRMLVFEFMPGGSLRSFLFNPEKRPPWRWRAEAALAIARGLEYLHDGCSAPIIHCDIKPDNILLDSHGVPRITDFGISKLLGTHQVHTTVTHVRGTRGYIAPEWLRGDARVDTKADVYSFGVVLLEMICCRKCQEPVAPDMPQGTEDDNETVTLFGWAAQLVSARRAEVMLDGEAEVDAVEDTGRVERFARVALWCMEPNPLLRPTMHLVVQTLESRDEDRVEALPPDPPSCYVESSPLIPQLRIE